MALQSGLIAADEGVKPWRGTRYDLLRHLLVSQKYALRPAAGGAHPEVTAISHALQTATIALRQNAPRAAIVSALFHDVARPLNAQFYGPIIAEILRDSLRSASGQDGYDSGAFDAESVWYYALRHQDEFAADAEHKTHHTESYRNARWFKAGKLLGRWIAASYVPNTELARQGLGATQSPEILSQYLDIARRFLGASPSEASPTTAPEASGGEANAEATD